MKLTKLILLLTSLLVLFFPRTAFSQEDVDCPEGYKCITEEEADDLREIVSHRQCMNKSLEGENDKFTFKTDPFTVVVTEKDQVFVKGKIKSHLKWCDYEIELESDPDLNVYMKEEDRGGWKFEIRPRVRLGFIFHPAETLRGSQFKEFFSPALLFEPFHIGLLHPEVHVGIKSFGLGAGVDITRNLDFYGAAASRWRQPLPIVPVAGLSLSFN